MAIAFARLEFVKRSGGKNACGKAAYNSRGRIHFEGSEWQEKRTYDWSSRSQPVYHDILLPEGVDPKFKNTEILWNLIEKTEVRRNSQTALELVLALPDDKVISLEDKKYLAKTFIEEHFVKRGLAAQIDIHVPDIKTITSDEDGSYQQADHNWHAHALITTRRFKENGQELDTHKARDLMPLMRGGKIISGAHWGKLWAQHQNAYFEQKGLSLRVDAEGIVAQKHLGPVRMRARAFSLFDENELLSTLNAIDSQDPVKVLSKVTQTKNIFTPEDIDRFLHKHTPSEKVFDVKDAFWKQTNIVSLLDPKTQKSLNKFTTTEILEEEKKLIRLADRLSTQKSFPLNLKKAEKYSEHLTSEQKNAFHGILSGNKLTCIEGHAGTGKSYLLYALKQAYESQKYTIRAFGPDSATSDVLKEKGFHDVENVYRFLFALHHGKRDIGNKEIWIVDETGKLGTPPLLELLKYASRYGAQVILSGNSAQLSSVERGSGFHTFSQRYQTHYLEDIQRQKEMAQREIAKKLAIGSMGEALDAISNHEHIKWYSTKENAMESLVKAWATNHLHNPNESSLIIAYSNKEIRTLNELAHQYRKEFGELQSKEYLCETAYGKIYVSCGDRIEFRENNSELGITTGTEGVLVKASETSFTVQVKEGNQTRRITYDPRTYRKFQLGYATTYHRSQGDTVEKAYVLHSPHLNKEAFYVGLTRHVKKAEFFVSEQDAKYLSDLKRQAYRTSPRESILNYITHSDLENQERSILKKQEIEDLKNSDSILARFKGKGLSTLGGIIEKSSKIVEKYKDRQPNQRFFNPEIKKESTQGRVTRVTQVPEDEEFKIEYKPLELQQESKPPRKAPNQSWVKLSEEKQAVLRDYFKSTDKASSFYAIVKADEGKSSHHQEWLEACGDRNSKAYEVVKICKETELRSLLGTKGTEILQERAVKHESLQQPKEDIDTRLKENLEALLYKLFPEGPSKRDSKSLRFGSKGSLAVTTSGSKLGSFFDFERHEGGGPIQLIQRVLHCSNKDAFSWAKDFIGQAPTTPIPSHFSIKKADKEQDWISLKPQGEAPTLKEISSSLAAHYKESARYTYKDADGGVLFHTIRIEDEKGKKMILPLSYGHYRGTEEKEASWSLKGYQAEKKPLYNLHMLKESPAAKVLIVEGEKTADAASKLFPNMICMTWSGGAGAVSKSDWQPLFMRDVIIWPDNDRAGFEASDALCKELRRVGVKSLHEVDKDMLAQELPPKWDLADPIPEGKGKNFAKDMILRASAKGVGLVDLQSYLKANGLNVDVGRAHQALCEVEEKLRPAFEKQFGRKTDAINRALLSEMEKVLKSSQYQSNKIGYEKYGNSVQYDQILEAKIEEVSLINQSRTRRIQNESNGL